MYPMLRYFILGMLCFWMIITDTHTSNTTIELQVPDRGLQCHTEERLQCRINSPPTGYALKWTKGSTQMAECSPTCLLYAHTPSRYTFTNTGSTTYTFVISNVTADDSDAYECSLSTNLADTKQLDVTASLSTEDTFVLYTESMTDETATIHTSTGCTTDSPGDFTYFACSNPAGKNVTFNDYTHVSTSASGCAAAKYCNLSSVKNTTDVIRINKSHQNGDYLLCVRIGTVEKVTDVSIDIPVSDDTEDTAWKIIAWLLFGAGLLCGFIALGVFLKATKREDP